MLRVVCLAAVFTLISTAVMAQDAARIAQGEKVYAAQKCGICHSIGGTGNTRGPLDGVGSKLAEEEIRMWIVDAAAMTGKTKAERKPPMRSFPNIAKDDLDALVAYMASLKK